MMDEIMAAKSSANDIRKSFGSMGMDQRAVVKLTLIQQLFGGGRYKPNESSRTTNFIYKTGSAVYELTARTNEVYVMQSYSKIVKPKLSIDELPKFGKILKLLSGCI